jgi:hypothetical protein
MCRGPDSIARDIFAASIRSSLKSGSGSAARNIVMALLL